MEKQNRIRRPGGAPPLAKMAESVFDGSPADRDAGPGPEEPGLSGGGPGAEDSSRGLGEDETRSAQRCRSACAA